MNPGGVLQPDESEAVLATAPEPRADETAVRSPQSAALVVQTSFLGDMVLTTPLIAELAKRGPVDVVATPASAPLLANNPSVRDVVVYDKRGADNGLRGLWRVTQALRSRNGDRRALAKAYLAQGSVRSAVLALLAGVDERIGFTTSPGRLLYTRSVLYRSDKHHAERLWRLAARHPDEEPTPLQLRPRLYPGANHVGKVDELLASNSYAGEPLFALAPGSIWGTKRWPYYTDLAKQLATRGRVAIIGSAADSALAREIIEAAGPSTIDSTGKLSLLASAELIARSVVLVTNDSAPQHLASAMGVPTVTVFGPTVPDFGFGPLAPKNATIGLELLPCRPCHKHGPQRCPLGHWRCMKDVGASTVLAAVNELT